ncbi:MAG: diacylglycerol kinase family lipid kinase [Chitinophagales bacterium]|nr:diacylglycerol kinase family lipid kinase [Chitinophagales bacterium]
MTKYFVSVNPNSGAGKAGRDWPLIKEKLELAKIDFDFATSTKHRENIEQVSLAIKQGYRKFIGVGGDGTLHHIVNAIFSQNEVDSKEIEVGLISIGTGNDWVRHFNMPTNYDKAIEIILAGKTDFQDIGCLIHGENREAEYFMNFVGIGYDAYVVEHTVELKKFGQSAYLYGLVQCLFKFEAEELRIEVDGKEILNGEVYMMIAGLGKYAGGGMMLSKDALINDGYFDLTIGKDLSKTEIIFMVHKLFNGSYVEHEKVETMRCKHIKVEAKNHLHVKAEADGELVGIGSFEISLLEKALKIVVP